MIKFSFFVEKPVPLPGIEIPPRSKIFSHTWGIVSFGLNPVFWQVRARLVTDAP